MHTELSALRRIRSNPPMTIGARSMLSDGASVILEQNVDPHHILARVAEDSEVKLFGEEQGVVVDTPTFVSAGNLCLMLAMVIRKNNPNDPRLPMLEGLRVEFVRRRDSRKPLPANGASAGV
jgi:hypothetical protein